jgi:signal transduction histidine kinase
MAMTTHDLRNALQSAQGAHDILVLAITGPDAAEAVSILGEALHRMTYLVDTLSRRAVLSRPPAPRSPAADLGRILTALFGRHQGVRADVPAGLRAACAPEDLERIVVNLGSNALAHGPPPIEIRGRSGSDFIEFTVTDHGPGVDPCLASALFDPYTRGQQHPRHPGSGLGLAIVRDLCLANGGQVTFLPYLPHGAQFRVLLPSPVSRK